MDFKTKYLLLAFLLLSNFTMFVQAGTVLSGASCTKTTDCVKDNACLYKPVGTDKASAGLRPPGLSCSANAQCASGTCSGGFCIGEKVCTPASVEQIIASLNPANPLCIAEKKVPYLGIKCCEGLQPNALGACDEIPMSDSALVACTNDASCSGGTACLPQSFKDHFSNVSPNTADEGTLDQLQQIFGSNMDAPKPNGGKCILATDCESYNCVKVPLIGGLCVEKRVCRFAREGETSAAQCGRDLIKSPSGSCIKDPNKTHAVYPGLPSGDASIGDKCKLNLPENYRDAAISAMKTTRALEYLFSNLTMQIDQEDRQQCFDDLPTMRDRIGKPFFASRLKIMKPFSTYLAQIEADQKLVMESSKKGDELVTIHDSERLKASELSTRVSSGYDAAILMYRRAKLMKEYEQEMLSAVNAAAPVALKFSENLLWGDWDSSWQVADQPKSAWLCRGSWYEKCKWWGLSCDDRSWDNVKDRWSLVLSVKPDSNGNGEILKRDAVANVLMLISGKKTKEEAIAPFNRSHLLLDPLLINGLPGNMGSQLDLSYSTGFLGFGKIFDHRRGYRLDGWSYPKIRDFFRDKIKEHYKKLREDPTQDNFVFEAELSPVEEKDCLTGKTCPEFNKYIEEMADRVMAYWMAWSYHRAGPQPFNIPMFGLAGLFYDPNYFRVSMAGFFTSNNYRNMLAARISADLSVLTDYYTKVINARTQQMECLSTLVGGLEDQGILASSGGLQEGGVYYNGTRPTGASGNGSTKGKTNGVVALLRSKFNYNLSGGNLQSLGAGSKMDSITKDATDSTAKGDFVAQAAALNAARIDAMRKANEKASAAGVNVAAKEEAYKQVISSMANRSGSGGGASSAASSSSHSTANPGSASVGKSQTSKGDGSNEMNTGKGDTQGDAGGAAAGMAGVAGGYGQGSSGDTNNAGDGKDHTGLSDDDKDRLMSEYEKSKDNYKEHEDDGLFKKVSKAYVRNLEKVLKKKKKVEE